MRTHGVRCINTLMCTIATLIRTRSPSSTTTSNLNKDEDTAGTKIIHLVSNPYIMAITNYLSILKNRLLIDTYIGLIEHANYPTGLDMPRKNYPISHRILCIHLNGELPTWKRIMTHDDLIPWLKTVVPSFEYPISRLERQEKGLMNDSTYYEHLVVFDPKEGANGNYG